MNENEVEKKVNKIENVSGIEGIKKWYRGLPDKKRYLELVSATLSIPILLTVLITNTKNLRGSEENAEVTSPYEGVNTVQQVVPNNAVGTTPGTTIIYVPQASVSGDQTVIPTSQQVCKPGIGSVSIAYPQEGEEVMVDPVCIDVSRQTSDYCSILWSYRINNGSWSDYMDKSICLYGLDSGDKTLQLKIRSVVNNEEVQLTRKFTVAGEVEATGTATESGNL